MESKEEYIGVAWYELSGLDPEGHVILHLRREADPLLYSPDFKDDFHPSGVIMGHYDPDHGWMGVFMDIDGPRLLNVSRTVTHVGAVRCEEVKSGEDEEFWDHNWSDD